MDFSYRYNAYTYWSANATEKRAKNTLETARDQWRRRSAVRCTPTGIGTEFDKRAFLLMTIPYLTHF